MHPSPCVIHTLQRRPVECASAGGRGQEVTWPPPCTEPPRLSPVTCRLKYSFLFPRKASSVFPPRHRPAKLSMGTVHARVREPPGGGAPTGTLTSRSVRWSGPGRAAGKGPHGTPTPVQQGSHFHTALSISVGL